MGQHQAKVVRITEILKHPNADSLGLVEIGGFQVVVRLDQFKARDLAIYIEPDSVVPELPQFKFVWERDGAGQLREVKESETPIPEKWRRITVRKFRKEWSEGLLMPVKDFSVFTTGIDIGGGVGMIQDPIEGLDVANLLGITHWNPPEDQEDSDPSVKQSRTRPRSFKGWVHFTKNRALQILSFGYYNPWGNLGGSNEKAPKNTPPIYDVENFKHYRDVFVSGEQIVSTEKFTVRTDDFCFSRIY